MQAVTIDPFGRPRLQELPDPVPAAGELVLRLRWSGLCGTDLFKLATGAPAPGTVLGHEVVGEVEAVGPGVTAFAPADRLVVPHHAACGVCYDCASGAATQCAAFRENLLEPGGFAGQILVRRRALATTARRLPDALDDLDAIFLEPAACVLRSLRRSPILAPLAGGPRAREAAPGEWTRLAVILGGGSMGLLHLLVLRALGAPVRIVVVDPREDRRHLARGLGADEAVPPGEALLAAASAQSEDGRGADAVFDCVGGSALTEAALAALRPGGTAVLFAHGRAGETAGFPLNDLFKLEKRLVGAYSGSLAEQSEVWELLCSGRLRPACLVSHRLALAEFDEGWSAARRQEALKVAFHP
ncbi:MAG: zinc-binding dehydrogenase [Thermoanaerobaculia bacterium]|nr:zinc-binding dehydrogenase [Thermoanaerobaculia bacterium]